MEAFAGSEDLQCEPSVTPNGQCDSQTVVSSPLGANENKAAESCELSLYDPNVAAVSILNLGSTKLVEVPVAVSVAVTDSNNKHTVDTGTPDIHINNRAIGPSRSWEDGYNWRKYGQKQIKGNEFPRSYYKCSQPNCQVKKQVEQSHDGRITDVIYRGEHDHPKPQAGSHTAACTLSSGQGDKILSGNGQTPHPAMPNDVSDLPKPNGTSEYSKPSSGNGQTSHHAMPNDVPDLSKPNGTSEHSKLSSGNGETSHSSTPKDVPEHAKPSVTSEHSYVLTADKKVEGKELSRTRDETQDNDDDPESKRRCLDSSTESTSASALYPPSNLAITSKALVPVEPDHDNFQQAQRSDIGALTTPTDQKRTCPTIDRFWGDGYNWRKYGQKHIKGSEFPRSYYRCTHPNCQVKKQLGCSQDGQITDIVYKGEHNHPRPLPNSHMAVGRILSVQEEGFERFTSSNPTHEKSSTEQTTHHTELNSQSETGKDSNHHNYKPCLEVALVSPPSVTITDTDMSPQDITPLAVSNSPVYMVTSRGIVPVEVDSEDKRQRVEGEESQSHSSNGISLSMTEKLLENAYHWRKYGQKNIKGSEFPRSYYRCTHPNCQVKMQMERSRDGRIIEIIYKGKHDHPKPQTITRMAIGAILSLEEDGSCDKLSPSGELVEAEGKNLSRSLSEIEDMNDMEARKRRKEMGDLEITPVIKTPREPRVVVETLSEVDVVDDGYRWQKYGRKIVKGNSNPRNYYRCSTGGCSVKKHVERSSNNPKAVVTTYEGKHNHDLLRARITTHDTVTFPTNNNAIEEINVTDVDKSTAMEVSVAVYPSDTGKAMDAVLISDLERCSENEGKEIGFSTLLNHSIVAKEENMES